MGGYTGIMKRPLLKEIRDDIERDDYISALGKWKWLNLKAKRSKRFGRGFPETVIDLGLGIYEKAIGLYVDVIERGNVERDCACTLAGGMHKLVEVYTEMLITKLEMGLRNPHRNEDYRKIMITDVEEKLKRVTDAASSARRILSDMGHEKNMNDGPD